MNCYRRRLDVGGYSLDVTCAGAGIPTMVLEAGLGGDTNTWEPILLALAAFTRVCAYDRAGVGASDPNPAPGPHSCRDAVRDPATISVIDWGAGAADWQAPAVLRLFNAHGHLGWTAACWMQR